MKSAEKLNIAKSQELFKEALTLGPRGGPGCQKTR